MATQGQTIDPKSGKIYRMQPPKERSPQFLGLSANAEAARIALVNYCNEKGYQFDIKKQQTVVGGSPLPDGRVPLKPVTNDKKLVELTESQKKAKTALKEYKTLNPEEFKAQLPGKASKKRNTPTMKVWNKPELSG